MRFIYTAVYQHVDTTMHVPPRTLDTQASLARLNQRDPQIEPTGGLVEITPTNMPVQSSLAVRLAMGPSLLLG